MRFTIRDLLWLTLLAAIVVAWWLDRRALSRRIDELQEASQRALYFLGDSDLTSIRPGDSQ